MYDTKVLAPAFVYSVNIANANVNATLDTAPNAHECMVTMVTLALSFKCCPCACICITCKPGLDIENAQQTKERENNVLPNSQCAHTIKIIEKKKV